MINEFNGLGDSIDFSVLVNDDAATPTAAASVKKGQCGFENARTLMHYEYIHCACARPTCIVIERFDATEQQNACRMK